MRIRLELFVADVDASLRFYAGVLGFAVERREPGYAHLRHGDAELGLATVELLPSTGPHPGFTRESVAAGHGAGVEIVLEVDDLERAARAVEAAGHALAEPPRDRPWGLRDFRVTDPDGYYLRVTTRT